MSKRFTFENFLKDLGMRLAAAAVVIGVFFGLGWVKRTDFLGLSFLVEGRIAFFAAAFVLIGVIAASWIQLSRTRK